MNGYLKVNSILKVNSTYVNYTDSSESGLTVFMVMKDRDNFHFGIWSSNKTTWNDILLVFWL